MPSPWLVVATLLSSFTVGLIPALVDSTRDALRRRLDLPEARVERLLYAFYIAWLPGMPLAGWLLDHLPNKEVLFFAHLGTVLGVAGLGLTGSARGLLGNLALLGLAYSGVATATVKLMSAPAGLGFTGSNVAALNLGFVAVGVGAVAGPWLLARAEKWGGPRQGFIGLGVALALPALLLTVSEPAEFPELPESHAWAGIFEARVGLIALVILLYFALETCLDVWPQQYLGEIGYSGRGRTVALVVFWAAFVGMRLAMGWLHPGYEVWLLLALVLGSAFAMGNLAGAYGGSSGSIGFWLVGLCYGPLLPGFLALVLDFGLPATALGYMLALSGLDTLIVRPLMTRYAKGHAARAVMAVPTVLALVLAAPLLVLALIRG